LAEDVPESEVTRFRFVCLAEAEHLLDVEQFARVAAALDTRSTTIYLENGVGSGPTCS